MQTTDCITSTHANFGQYCVLRLWEPTISPIWGSTQMSWRRAIRAVLIGAITFIFALIYVPQCRVQIYVENANLLSFGVGAVMTFVAYRFR
jgi:hypothetical protein